MPVQALLLAASAITLAGAQSAKPAATAKPAPEPLAWTRTIALPDVYGRVDQLAVDLAAFELFLACSSQGSVEVVDLAQGRWSRRSAELDSPQGIALLAAQGLVAVAVAGDGSVHFLDARTLEPRKVVEVGDDPRHLTLDPTGKELWVALDPGIAVLDVASLELARRVELGGRAAAIAFAPSGDRAFVSLPGSAAVALIERGGVKPALSFALADATGNHGLALDDRGGTGRTLLVAARSPAELQALDARSGKVQARLECSGDVGDVIWDAERQRAYALGEIGRAHV